MMCAGYFQSCVMKLAVLFHDYQDAAVLSMHIQNLYVCQHLPMSHCQPTCEGCVSVENTPA